MTTTSPDGRGKRLKVAVAILAALAALVFVIVVSKRGDWDPVRKYIGAFFLSAGFGGLTALAAAAVAWRIATSRGATDRQLAKEARVSAAEEAERDRGAISAEAEKARIAAAAEAEKARAAAAAAETQRHHTDVREKLKSELRDRWWNLIFRVDDQVEAGRWDEESLLNTLEVLGHQSKTREQDAMIELILAKITQQGR